MTGLVKQALLMTAIATAAIAALPDIAEAQRRSRPETKWCLRGPSGGQSCGYHTLEQCRKAAFGTGSSCMRNPRFGR
ncbi:MAG: DUF3551 domain-containing protein [Pseudorhodoplanes sp.]|uniref:DUF3551 domain-containing protein n=1 Tax=Pseudorhodoplanes sp. TaxID=1934341 RepID=UPI003D0A2705